jgi:hypothetical protein
MASQASEHDLPTPRSTLAARFPRVLVTCRACHHQRAADLHTLIDAARGDTPLARLRWRCARCRSDRVDMIQHQPGPPAPYQLPASDGHLVSG